jgi:hypothetical protein
MRYRIDSKIRLSTMTLANMREAFSAFINRPWYRKLARPNDIVYFVGEISRAEAQLWKEVYEKWPWLDNGRKLTVGSLYIEFDDEVTDPVDQNALI